MVIDTAALKGGPRATLGRLEIGGGILTVHYGGRDCEAGGVMAYGGMRDYLRRLEAEGEVAHVGATVDLQYEVGAICFKTLRARGPALVFDRPGGYDVPLAVNLFANRKRYALAIEAEPEAIHAAWTERMERPIPPVVVDDGPCKENVLRGDDVDLGLLPVPTWNGLDGGAFITLACHISKDVTTGSHNV